MNKIRINMLSNADKVAGQGVGSAYKEQVDLIQNDLSEYFDVVINDNKSADIIHCHTVYPEYLMKMKMNKGKNVVYVHFLPDTLDGSIQLPKSAFNIFKKYVLFFYESADYLVVVNPAFIEDLVRYGLDRHKIVYIPNYVSKDMFHIQNPEIIHETKAKYHINGFSVLGVGQVQNRKGVKDFVEVAKQLPDIHFIWAGGFSFGMISDGYEELKQIYENPPDNVDFIGIVDRQEMNSLYNIADILFMPSYNELFPMSILEAVNSYTPLLLRDLDLYERILFHNYLSANDNEGFILAIRQLQNNPELYASMQQKSKDISDYYSKEHVKEIWKNFYLDIAKDPA